MTQTLTTTTATAPHVSAGLGAPLVEIAVDQPQYRHVGHQRFMPANEAAREEVARWNAYADAWNARTARSVRQ